MWTSSICTRLNYKIYFLFDGNRWPTNELCCRIITAFDKVVDRYAQKRKAARKEKNSAKIRDHQWTIIIDTKQK